MKPAAFAYERPESLEEAVEILVRHGDEAKILAGGQSLIPMMNYRLAAPPLLVDISRIPGLREIGVADARLTIGGLVTHQQVATSQPVADTVPILAEAASLIGHLAIRNRGTIAGSLAHSDPAAEWPLMCRLLDTDVHVHGPDGERIVPGGELNLGFLQTSLGDHDVITGVSFAVPEPTAGWGFVEFARRHGDFALAMAAATLGIRDGVIDRARVGLGSVDSTPIRAGAAEDALIGRPAGDEAFAAAGRLAAEACNPPSDVHATADYRRRLVEVLTARALRAAADRAGTAT